METRKLSDVERKQMAMETQEKEEEREIGDCILDGLIPVSVASLGPGASVSPPLSSDSR